MAPKKGKGEKGGEGKGTERRRREAGVVQFSNYRATGGEGRGNEVRLKKRKRTSSFGRQPGSKADGGEKEKREGETAIR